MLYSHALYELLFVVAFVVLVPDTYSYKKVVTVVFVSFILLIDVPGGLVDYPRAYQNQLREFNSHRVHIVLVGTFSCIKFD